jgi:hypothetical protein
METLVVEHAASQPPQLAGSFV